MEAVLALTDEWGWSLNFNNDSDDVYNLSNACDFLKHNNLKAIANYQIEADDTSGIPGQLQLNGTIVHPEEDGGLFVKDASDVIDNYWEKIGEKEPYECVVLSTTSPHEVTIILEDGSEKNIQAVN